MYHQDISQMLGGYWGAKMESNLGEAAVEPATCFRIMKYVFFLLKFQGARSDEIEGKIDRYRD